MNKIIEAQPTASAARQRTFVAAFKHYLFSGKGKWVVGKLVLRLFPFLYAPFAILNNVIPVLGWIDDLPIALYILYILFQVNRHRDVIKYP